MDNNMDSKKFLSFYTDIQTAKDQQGRTFEKILSLSDMDLERCHDFIQLLFPLPEPSLFNSQAPIIDKLIFNTFRSEPQLRAHLRLAFHRMLRFYGFEMTTGETIKVPCRIPSQHNQLSNPAQTKLTGKFIKVKRAGNFAEQAQNWVHAYDHNHQRITRILRCLRLLGLEEEARAFYEALEAVVAEGRISRGSFLFWTRAAKRPLHIAPDVNEDEEDRQSLQFLQEAGDAHGNLELARLDDSE